MTFIAGVVLAALAAQDVETLIERLSNDDIAVREDAQRRLAELGKDAEPALRRRLARAEGEAGGRILRAIHAIEIAAIRALILDPVGEVTIEGGDTVSIAYSGDGKLLATGGELGDVILWDADTGARLATLQGDGRSINAIAFSPDSRRLLTGGRNAVLWDVEKRERIETWTELQDTTAVAWSPDGRWLAHAGYDLVVRDAKTLNQVHRRWDRGHSRRSLKAIAFSPQTDWVAFDLNARLAVYRIPTADRVPIEDVMKMPEEDVAGLAFLPDGEIAYALEGGPVRFAGATFRHTSDVTAVAVTRDGARIALGGDKGAITVWDRNGKLLESHHADAFVNDLAWSPDGRSLAAAVDRAPMRIWRDGRHVERSGHAESPRVLAFSPNGRHLAVSGRAHTVFYDLTTKARTIAASRTDPAPGNAGGEVLLAAERSIEVWDALETRCIRTIADLETRPSRFALAPGGMSVVYQGNGLYLNRQDGQPPFMMRSRYSRDAAWHPDGKLLAVAEEYGEHGDFGDIGLYTEMGFLSKRIETPEGRGRRMCVAFEPGGRHLYWMVEAHDRRTWQPVEGSSRMHVVHVASLVEVDAFETGASDWRFAGEGMAVTHSSENVSLWHYGTKTRVQELAIPNVRRMTLSRDGRSLALAFDDRVRVYAIKPR